MLKEYNVSHPFFFDLAKLPSILCLLSLSELIHSLNKLPFEHLPACLIFLPEKKFGLIAFNLGLIVLLKRGLLDPWWPFSKWNTALWKSYVLIDLNCCFLRWAMWPMGLLFSHFHSSQEPLGQYLNQPWHKASLGEGVQVSLYKGSHPFPRRDNKGIVKIHWQN